MSADDMRTEDKGRPTGRPSLEAAGQLEEALLVAALKVFIDAGFQAASMEAIAREAGVTKRTLYRRARNKGDLFVDVVDRLAQQAGMPQLSCIAPGPLEQRLTSASVILLEWLLEPKSLALYRLVVAEAAQHPGLARTVDGPFQRATDAVAAILAFDDSRPVHTIRLGADMFVRLVAGEALDRAAQGIEPAGVTEQVRERSFAALDFFLAGWRTWRL